MNRGSASVYMVFALAVVAALSLNAPECFSAPTESKQQITDAEKIYVNAAITYLNKTNALGKRLTKATVNSASLDVMHNAISDAQALEEESYRKDFVDKIRNDVPPRFAKEMNETAEAHGLFQASLNEYLKFWKDSQKSHITNGRVIFKRWIRAMKKAIGDTTLAVKTIKPAKDGKATVRTNKLLSSSQQSNLRQLASIN